MNISNISSTILQPNASSFVFISIGVVMTIVFFLALFGDISILTVYNRTKLIQNTSNLWVISVLYCDLFIVLNSFPLVITSSFAQKYILGEPGCIWDGFVVTWLGITSIYLFAGLSIHRYRIMSNVGHNSEGFTRRKSKMLIVFCFFLGLVWGIAPLLGWGSFALEGLGVSCAPDWRSRKLTDITYIACMYILALLVPLCIIIYCYFRILMQIWGQKRNHSVWIQQRRVRRDIRVTVSVAFTILSFLVSWMPYTVVCLLESFFNMDLLNVSPMLVQLPCLMAKTACVWNPLVYVCHNSQFRKAFIQHFGISRIFSQQSRETELEMIGSGESARSSRNTIKLNRRESHL